MELPGKNKNNAEINDRLVLPLLLPPWKMCHQRGLKIPYLPGDSIKKTKRSW